MARPAPSANRHQDILDAAAELFYARSFAAVGIDAIGERAGITGPAVYRHFGGKNEILATLFDEAIDGLLLATSRTSDDAWEELEHLVRGHGGYVIANRRLAGVKIREERSLTGPARKRLHQRERRYLGRWAHTIARCRPTLSAREVSMAVQASVGMLNSIATWPSATLEAPDIPDRLAAMVRGLVSQLDPA